MKTGLVLLATIVAVILIGSVAAASAQTGSTPDWSPMGAGMMGYTDAYTGTMPMWGMMHNYTGTMPFRGGMMGGNPGAMRDAMMAAGGMHEQVMTAVATRLGMTYDQLTTALQNGQTIAQIADAKGVSLEALQQVANTARTSALNQLVQQGVITREQADWMLDRMDDMPMFDLGAGNGACPGLQPNGAQPGGYGPGMMGGGRGMMERGMTGRGSQPAGRQG
jgi:hypothetical protein